MTEKTKTKTAAAAKSETAAFAPVNQILETLKGAKEKLQVPTAARDFVKRNAETAKARAAEVEKGVLDATVAVEKSLVAVVGAGATMQRGLVDAAIANVNLTLGAMQTIVEATSLQEAGERYVAYLRDLSQSNMVRAQQAFNTIRQTAADGAKAVQAEAGKFGAFGKAA